MNKSFAYLLASVLFVASSTTAMAFGFSTVNKKEDSVFTFSKCGWESDPHHNKVPLSCKPGKGDLVWINVGGKKFIFDASPTVGSIRFLYAVDAIMEGKKLSTMAGGIHMEAGSHPNNNNVFTMKNSLGDIRGSITFSIWTKVKGMGNCKIVLDNSKIESKGDIIFRCPPYFLKATKNRSGIDFDLTGDSYIRCKGEILLDSILTSTPDLHFRLTINEKDGKVPFYSFKGGDVTGAELHVNIKGKLKKGIYPLVEFTTKDSEGKFRGIYINGKSVSLGSTVTAGGSDVVIRMGSADKKKENDYVLEVK